MQERQTLLRAARRDLGRLQKVTSTIVRHGFGELLLKSPLGRRLLSKPQQTSEGTVQGSPAVRFTSMLASLGPTFIKLGQILSMRPDLFGEEWIRALSTLQDKAPEVPFASVQATVEEALAVSLGEAFASFDSRPLATASIAQTHRAVTHDGEQVVVKVQRPGIEDQMRGDLNLLYLAAQILEASIDEMQLVGITDIVREFERGLLRELDFQEELGNLLRIRGLLDPEHAVRAPRPFPDLSGKTVLTMEFFAGPSIRKMVPRSEEAKRAVAELVHAMSKQVFVDGFFHGDPHAGNILVDERGTLCMIDWGLVGTLSEAQRADVVTLLIATFANDSASIARILLRMGTPTRRVNLSELKGEIERIRGKYIARADVGNMNSAGFVQEFAQAAQEFRIKLASEYSILIKSIATLEGVVRALAPDLDIVSIARGHVQQSVMTRLSPQRLLGDFASEMGTLGSMATRIPAHVDQLLYDFESGNLQIRALTPRLDALPLTLHHAASRVSLSLFAASMALCSALTLPQHWPDWPRFTLALGLALASAIAWLVLLGWHFLRGRRLKVTPLVRLFKRD